MSPSRWYRRGMDYLAEGLWAEVPQPSRGRRLLQFVVLTGRDFLNDQCVLRASALTYATLLAIVPLLALMFSLLKGLGVQNTLEPIILAQVAVGSEEVVQRILAYIDNVNVGRLGAFGLVALIVTVLALLSNIEKSFNRVWGVAETRPLRRRFADYLSVITVGPVLLLAAISMTSGLKSQALVRHLMETAYLGELVIFLFNVLPYLAMWAVFSGLYIFMPNARVSLRAAVVGGIVGGSLWQIAQWGYISFQVGIGKFNAIYGTMAALPVFMVWIYVSWVIVLLGLEVAYVSQFRKNLSLRSSPDMNWASREGGALAIIIRCSRSFLAGEKAPRIEDLCTDLQLSPRLLAPLVRDLVRLGFLSEITDTLSGADVAYQPALSPERMMVSGVLEALHGDGESLLEGKAWEIQAAARISGTVLQATHSCLKGMTLAELIGQD